MIVNRGAAVFLDTCVGSVLNLGLADLPEAVAMAAIRPRELLGLPVPRIEPGEPADFILFDWPIYPQTTPMPRLRVRHPCV